MKLSDFVGYAVTSFEKLDGGDIKLKLSSSGLQEDATIVFSAVRNSYEEYEVECLLEKEIEKIVKEKVREYIS